MVRFRAERTDFIPSVHVQRADGSVIEVDGIRLLDNDWCDDLGEARYFQQVADVIAEPVADLLDTTTSITDLVPLLTRRPGWAMLNARNYLAARGHELPSNK